MAMEPLPPPVEEAAESGRRAHPGASARSTNGPPVQPKIPVELPAAHTAPCDSHDNQWPEWVFVKMSFGARSGDRIPLRLVIHFAKHTRELGGGEVEFGLSAGDLYVETANGSIPVESRKPQTPLQVAVEKEIGIADGTTSTFARTGDAKANVGIEGALPKASIEVGRSASSSTEISTGRTEKYSRTEWQVSTKGSEDKPIWSFEARDGVPFLRGGWNEEIGTVVVAADPCRIAGRFVSSPRHVVIEEVDGVFAGWTMRMMKFFRIGVYRELRSLGRYQLTCPAGEP